MAGTVGVNFAIGAALSRTVGSAFGTVQSRVKGLRSDLRGLETQSKAAARLSAAQARLETARARYAAQSTPQMRAALRTAVREFGNAHRAAKEYGISVDNAGRAQERLAQRIQRTQAALSRQQRLQANQAKRSELQGQVLGAVGAAMTVAAPVKLAIDYESTFADLKKVANFSDAAQESQVRKDIFAAAQRTGISATGMTAIAASAAESGVANDARGNLDPKKLKQFLNDAAEMAVAYGISAEEAGERLAVFQGRMGLNADQTKAMGDAMNYLASKTTATAAKTSQVVSRVGAVGVTAGLSAKSIVGLAGAFVSTSESPEVAGTAMKSFLLAMAQGDAMSKTQRDAFAKIGIRNVKALAEGMKKGGPEAENTIMTVFEAMRKLPEAEQAGIAKDIFGLESFASIAPLVNNPQKLQEAFRLANSTEAVGSQLREFKTRSETTAGAIERLKSSTGVLGVTVGSVLLPPLVAVLEAITPMIQGMSEWASEHESLTTVLVGGAAALAALKVATLGARFAWSGLQSAGLMLRAPLSAVEWLQRRGARAGDEQAAGARSAASALHAHARAGNAAGDSMRSHGQVGRAAAAGLSSQGRAARVASGSLRLMGKAWKVAMGPVGLVITIFETLYNNISGVKEAVDGFIDMVAEKFPVIGKPLKAIAAFFGIGSDAEEEGEGGAEQLREIGGAAAEAFAREPEDAPAPSRRESAGSRNAANRRLQRIRAAQRGGADFTPPDAAVRPSHAQAAGSAAVNLAVHINGMPDGEFGKRVVDALKRRQGELESLIASIVDEQRRLAYG